MRLFSFCRRFSSGGWKRSAVVLLSVAAAAGIALALHVLLNEAIPFLPFTLAVVVSSVYGGLYSGLAATVLCFSIADYYFIEPLHTFFPVQPGEVALLALFLAVGITISLLHSKLAAANEALLRTRERNKLAAEIGRIGFVEFTPPDRLVWTAETEKLFGLEAGVFEGNYEAWMRRIHPDDRERIDQLRKECMARGVPEMTYSYRAVLPDGSVRWLEGRNRLFYSENGEVKSILGAKIDVTDRALLEAALEEKTEALSISNRQLDRYAHIVSHDLREPLRGVGALGDLLLRRLANSNDAESKRIVALMIASVERMQSLVQDLLASSEANGASPLDEVDMRDVAELAQNDLRALIEQHRAKIEIGSLPAVRGRRLQLLRLLENLIANAIKYRGPRPPEIAIAAEPGEACWIFSVRDNGIGISEPNREKVFLMYERLHGAAGPEGTGMGLAICRQIVEQHGGRIWVESEVGIGSTFYFTLPMTGSEELDSSPRPDSLRACGR